MTTIPTNTTTPPRPRRVAREAGSITVWLAAMSLSLVLLVGLAVDGSGQIHAKQRAQAIAAEAARAGAQQLLAQDAVRGQDPVLDPPAAIAAATTYLAGVPEISGTAALTSATTVAVTTSATYTTTFLNLIGITTLTVTGHAEADLNRTLDGASR